MVIAEISVVPLGTGTTSTSKYVARVIEVLRQEKDLRHELTAMGTIIEGGLEEVLGAIRRVHEALFDDEVKRVVTTIKIDDRRDKDLTMGYKVQSVLEKVKD